VVWVPPVPDSPAAIMVGGGRVAVRGTVDFDSPGSGGGVDPVDEEHVQGPDAVDAPGVDPYGFAHQLPGLGFHAVRGVEREDVDAAACVQFVAWLGAGVGALGEGALVGGVGGVGHALGGGDEGQEQERECLHGKWWGKVVDYLLAPTDARTRVSASIRRRADCLLSARGSWAGNSDGRRSTVARGSRPAARRTLATSRRG
jgi:hypothetical protein